MNAHLPWSEACERNREPIWRIIRDHLPDVGEVLEIGSCTGQHVTWFAARRASLTWQPSDRTEYLEGLQQRLAAEGSANIRPAVELDVLAAWPERVFDAVYSANTSHIMPWPAVCAMFRGVGAHLAPGGMFCLYGPFNLDGEFTAPSNAQFDQQLRSRDPQMGLREVKALDSLAAEHHLRRTGRYNMPANNMVLVYQRELADHV